MGLQRGKRERKGTPGSKNISAKPQQCHLSGESSCVPGLRKQAASRGGLYLGRGRTARVLEKTLL